MSQRMVDLFMFTSTVNIGVSIICANASTMISLPLTLVVKKKTMK